MRLRVDSSGRVVVPAEIREALGIDDEVEAVDTPDGLLLRAPGAPSLDHDESGLLVVSIGRAVTADEVDEAIQDDRERRG